MNQLILSLIAGTFIGGLSAFIGTLMLPKKMSLSADPLSHLALPGVALALIYGIGVWLGALPFVIFGIILIWFLNQRTRLSFESLIAIVFSLSLAIAFLFLPIEQAEEALIGDILNISFAETIIAVISSLILGILVQKIYKQTTLINISEELAIAQKINVSKFNLIYLMLVGLVVILGVKLAGGLLVAALVAIPPASVRNFSFNLAKFKTISILIGGFCSFLGIYLAYKFYLPASPIIIILSSFIFLASLFFKKS